MQSILLRQEIVQVVFSALSGAHTLWYFTLGLLITDEKLVIILKVIELSDNNALGQIHELIANKSSVPLSSIEKENVISALKDAESGRIPSRGGLFPDYL